MVTTHVLSALGVLLLPLLLLAQAEAPRATRFNPETLRTASVEILRDGHLAGTGFFVDTNGTVFTAAHVLDNPSFSFEIRTHGGLRLPVKVEAVDEGHDIARLGLENPATKPDKIVALPLAKRAPREGQVAYHLGTPIFRHHVIFTGHLAHSGINYEYAAGHFTGCIYAAAAAPKGCSGGPWVNRRGEVFGIQCAYVSVANMPQGLSMIAPPKALNALLARKEHAATPTMDAAVEELFSQQPAFIKDVGYEGPSLVARQVKKDGPAGTAGLKEFDLITSIDGKAHDTTNGFLDTLRRKKPGERITLSVRDKTGKNPRELEITLGRLETHWIK